MSLDEATLPTEDASAQECVHRRQRALALVSQAATILGEPVIYLICAQGELIVGQRGEDAKLAELIDMIKGTL